MEFLQDLFVLIGRICIGGMFLWGAYIKIKNWHVTVNHMRAKGVPQLSIVMPAAMVLKVLGGISVLLGWHSHLGALLLLIAVIPFTYWSHPFWKMQGNEMLIERASFMKEIGIIGGLFLLLAMGAGHFALGGG